MRHVSVFCMYCVWLVPSLGAQTAEKPVRAVTDPGVVTTRQSITPAGVPAIFDSRVYGVVFGRDSAQIYVLTANAAYRLDWKQNKVLERAAFNGSPGLQGIQADGERAVFTVSQRSNRAISVLEMREGRVQTLAENVGAFVNGALAISEGLIAIPLIYNNKLAVLDSQRKLTLIPTEIAPFGVVLNRDRSAAYVSNWGGRIPRPADLAAPTGYAPQADRVVVDQRGIAASGTVIRVDLQNQTITHRIAVDPHPTAMVWDETRHRLYVANSNRDRITVIDTQANRLLRSFELQPFPQKVYGISPNALALSQDGSRLYVACGGINAVAQMVASTGQIEGLIPTGWYPSSVSLSADGRYLAVGSLLGAGSGWREAPSKRFVHAYRGSVGVIELPDAAQLASYTTAVYENNHVGMLAQANAKPDLTKPAVAIPSRAGERSLIEHVVYIVKENRTYDQVFGDMPKGNGDPALVLFGEEVTPNHHRLADQFVLLDNFYATGGNSADGHQWLTQSNQNAYAMWPGFAGRSYPFDGSDPLAISDAGFFWSAALRLGKTVRIYGEYAGLTRETPARRLELMARWEKGDDFATEWNHTAPIASLNAILAKNYPGYSTYIPDVVRARLLISDIRRWEQEGKMPHLVILNLPSDHTNGAAPGTHTPRAMVADNDLALGQIVEALTRTRFWKKMAIFVVEDDAQNGVDHVDGHRTVALAISPYIRRGHVDSTFYSNQSMVKTIELILGLPTLSLFDMIANDMRNSFRNEPDFTPYEAVRPKQSLTELNPDARALRGPAREAALASARMNWVTPDAAPTEKLNRILWGLIKGWQTPYPPVRQAVFSPLALDVDDDDRE
ncbi:MAG: bifunctional YncE family protein/alkaline phosphatase family protein [Bryobacteraceae bacterium]|nr:bifunctional YncE family protein/alkaline phosphatase family protein [Bryobacteraceae bacterium]MDW8378286.1 bifunctional YncE family protein/alkaline phosphatase family protein [Bryobacterales bacterium]